MSKFPKCKWYNKTKYYSLKEAARKTGLAYSTICNKVKKLERLAAEMEDLIYVTNGAMETKYITDTVIRVIVDKTKYRKAKNEITPGETGEDKPALEATTPPQNALNEARAAWLKTEIAALAKSFDDTTAEIFNNNQKVKTLQARNSTLAIEGNTYLKIKTRYETELKALNEGR